MNKPVQIFLLLHIPVTTPLQSLPIPPQNLLFPSFPCHHLIRQHIFFLNLLAVPSVFSLLQLTFPQNKRPMLQKLIEEGKTGGILLSIYVTLI